MEIKIQAFNRIYSICIGKKTEWFAQSNWISICRLWYDDKHEVSYAVVCFKAL